MIRWIFFLTAFFSVAHATETNAEWKSTTWNGEKALVAVSSGWKAIVSLDRSRLVLFGRAADETNLLFAPATKQDPAGWGGHRLWLGPQSTWSGGWPPPSAWEHSGVESFSEKDGTLRLIIPDAGDGWPRLVRTYRWNGDHLICTAELSGGSRSVQFIHIVQIPAASVVTVSAAPRKVAPLGYVLLPSTATPRFTTDFRPPPHVSRDENDLTLHHLKKVMKLGFVPQALLAREGNVVLKMNRVRSTETSSSEPDQGFFTQVYLGGFEPFIEMEQLSPMCPAGKGATFSFELQGATP